MEMTKNRITKLHVIAMIFCRSLGARAENSDTRERFAASSANPASAKPTQARLSNSSMVEGYGMHSIAWEQQAFENRFSPAGSLRSCYGCKC